MIMIILTKFCNIFHSFMRDNFPLFRQNRKKDLIPRFSDFIESQWEISNLYERVFRLGLGYLIASLVFQIVCVNFLLVSSRQVYFNTRRIWWVLEHFFILLRSILLCFMKDWLHSWYYFLF